MHIEKGLNEDVLSRDLVVELRDLGLTLEQCEKILNWTETLPIHVIELSNTKVSIKQGIVLVEPNVQSPK